VSEDLELELLLTAGDEFREADFVWLTAGDEDLEADLV
jgi:hypothetical protein